MTTVPDVAPFAWRTELDRPLPPAPELDDDESLRVMRFELGDDPMPEPLDVMRKTLRRGLELETLAVVRGASWARATGVDEGLRELVASAERFAVCSIAESLSVLASREVQTARELEPTAELVEQLRVELVELVPKLSDARSLLRYAHRYLTLQPNEAVDDETPPLERLLGAMLAAAEDRLEDVPR